MTVQNAINKGYARVNLIQPKSTPYRPIPWRFPTVRPPVREAQTIPVTPLIKPVDPTLDTFHQEYFEDCHFDDVTDSPYVGFYEVARFYSPHGRIGFVRQCWQWLELENPISAPPVIGTPFDALAATRDAGSNPVQILWRLRLIHGNKTGNYDKTTNGAVADGYGYPGLPNFTQIRFPWGSAAPVFFLIPEHFTLSLFADIQVGKNVVKSIGGRLAGYLQPVSKCSQFNARYGFQW